jgi:hypothetical protein
MTPPDEQGPWQPDPGDAVNPDLTSGVGAEDLDEDRIGLDPLEEGMDPPERWEGSDRFGVSADEQRDGESLDQRLAEETADVGVDEPEVLDEDDEYTARPDPSREAADEAGGSVAQRWRTPDPDNG